MGVSIVFTPVAEAYVTKLCVHRHFSVATSRGNANPRVFARRYWTQETLCSVNHSGNG